MDSSTKYIIHQGKRVVFKTYENIFDEVSIGSQTWMKYNLVEGGTPYNFVDGNREFFGALYTWDDVSALSFPGWHVPTLAEFNTLFQYVGETNLVTYGFPLKDTCTSFWSDVSGHTNSSGFSARGSGYQLGDGYGDFSDLMDSIALWTSTDNPDLPPGFKYTISIHGDSFQPIDISTNYVDITSSWKFAIRLIKD